MGDSINKGPRSGPQYTMIFALGTPKTVLPIFGKIGLARISSKPALYKLQKPSKEPYNF